MDTPTLSYQPFLDELTAFASSEARREDLIAAKAEYFQQTGEVFEDGPEQAAAFRAFTETLHGLFEVRKVGKGLVRLRELFSGKDYDVTERRQTVGLEKGDILEARLIPFEGHLLFSQAFIFHPRDAGKAIRAEVKRRKKHEPQRPPVDLTWDCARRQLKTERYRQIPVERIYDFTQTKI